MRIFENDLGVVEKGWFTGFRFTIKASGRKTKATPFMKHLMGAIHAGLLKRGLHSIENPAVSNAFWEFFLDMAASPANGLYHRAIASEPVEEHVDYIARMAEH